MIKKQFLFFAFFFCGFSVFGQDATQIIQSMIDKMQGSSNKSESIMEIVRPEWKRTVKMKGWQKGDDYALTLITAPARDKGAAFLKREKEIWNWQPSIDRVIKLPPSMMQQSWMGSDFTNDDLVKQSSFVRDFNHRLVSDTTLQGYDVYKIEMIPTEEAAVVWGKIEMYVEKKDYIQLLVKFYDEDMFLVNSMHLSKVKEIQGRKFPTYMEMIPAENPNQKTTIEYTSIVFDIDISDNFFSIQNLKRLR